MCWRRSWPAGVRGPRASRRRGGCRARPRSSRPGSGPGRGCCGNCSARWPGRAPRRRDQQGIELRVVEYALDTPAGPGRETYRLITSLLDERAFPAQQLAATYHERWEIETALDEVKVHQWAHPRPLRSKHPREVVQEVYGLLLAHLAIRTVMHQAALHEGIDPDRLGFTGALRVLRRAIPRAQRTPPEHLPLFPPAC